jgi:uncharacterized membrane protein
MQLLFKKLTPERRLRWSVFALLALTSTISVAILVYRNTMSSSHEYLFLVLNLNLAWIPFIMATLVYSARHLPKTPRFVVTICCGGLWLLFMPNAAYLLTDFQHLARNNDAPLWYDIIMLLWFAWAGLLLGIFSLYYMQELVARSLGKLTGWLFTLGIIFLNSYGVYLGRFMRWNSWDLIRRPEKIISDILNNFSYPENYQTILLYTGLYGLLFLAVYVTFFLFGQLVNAHRQGTG